MAKAPSLTPLLAIIVVIVVGAGIGSGVLYYHFQPATPPGVLTVAVGDNVTVNYIGIFGSGPEQGKVFDTSIYSVATDSIAYPKALQFHLRGSAANYTPLAVHVGTDAPSGGYSLGGQSFITVVTGFWQGLVGLTGNATRTVAVPPYLGYGSTNPACVAVRPLSFTVPQVETLSGTAFTKAYPGVTAVTGATFPQPAYGWPVIILSSNASFVTIENAPSLGWTSSPAGWPVEVTGIGSTANGTGAITLTNELYPSQAGLLQGKDYLGNGPCTSQSGGAFIVTAVDLAQGTYTENFNPEVQGQTLIFLVTIVDIYP